MSEKIDELYQEYLEQKLNDIFVIKNQGVPKLIDFKGKYNYKTDDKNPLCDEWFLKANEFSEGFAVVKYSDGKYGYIDINGEPLLGKVRFDDASDFFNGYGRIVIGNGKQTKYNYIDKTGKLLSKKWYDCVFPFYEGRGIVIQNDKYGFIDTEGNLIGGWYNEASRYVDGIACVRIGDRFTYIDKNGNPIKKDLWFSEASAFTNGRALVKQISGLYNFIDCKGNLLSNEGYTYVHKPIENYTLVGNRLGKYGLVDANCNLVGEWYEDVATEAPNLYLIRKKRKKNKIVYNFFDASTGQLLLDEWKDNRPYIERAGINYLLIYYGSLVLFFDKYLDGYNVKKKLTGYQCSKDNDKFTIKYEPVKIIGKKYVLCCSSSRKNMDYYLFDRENNSYKRLGKLTDMYYTENFIRDYSTHEEKYYFTYNGEMYDITGYYKKYLKDNKIIEIKKGVEILSKDDFFIKKEELIRNEYHDDEKNKREEQEKRTKEEENIKLAEIKKQNEASDVERQEKYNEALKELKEAIDRLEQLEQTKHETIRIPVKDIFIDVGSHKEINPLYLEIGLKHIDLKGVSFDGVKIAGIDFRGCNISFNPQRVSERDLRGCNFEGILIPIFTDFTGVDIRGAKFSKANDANTMNVINAYFREAIYDETTTYDGIPLTELIEIDDINQSKK